MKIDKETIGTAVLTGVVCGVLLSVAILSVSIALIEALFEKLMWLTTLLREKTMTLFGSIARIFSRSATDATTTKLKTKSAHAKDLTEKVIDRLH
jgi:hypothetical protein